MYTKKQKDSTKQVNKVISDAKNVNCVDAAL